MTVRELAWVERSVGRQVQGAGWLDGERQDMIWAGRGLAEESVNAKQHCVPATFALICTVTLLAVVLLSVGKLTHCGVCLTSSSPLITSVKLLLIPANFRLIASKALVEVERVAWSVGVGVSV